ncbi:MAG: 5'-3' exonuclease FEN1 [Candidatus Methanohalarchaeum thermophilum]|uniref:Flap endonuclease 1 n=1 Tax=Methanohalarchaeum thermophilum TaxID=1903181 RepID=A0A1Q6DSA2_METT1|nr:MAG: 5'-3' exonuclease FEN1 [Candidatus Methanohalarchaeum thermophilum]
MGVELSGILDKKEIQFNLLYDKEIAIDAYNSLYQFLSIIRQPNGKPLQDSDGNTTSHLSGLFYRTINLIEKGIKPIYVFDGEPPSLKKETIKERRKNREESRKEWKKAIKEGKKEKAFKKATMSSKLTKEMVEESKDLLDHMGVPVVNAPSEGEAQAAHMVKKGDAWSVGSQDFDSLLFGSPYLIKNLTITGKRKLPNKDEYIKINLEEISLKENLERLGISREDLIDIAILIGTDYNEGIKGIGPKKALNIIKKHEDIFSVVENEEYEIEGLKEIRELFLSPKVTDEYKLKWGELNKSKIKQFLCNRRDFSEDRVKKASDRLDSGLDEIKSQSTLDSF